MRRCELEGAFWRAVEAGRFTVNAAGRALQYRATFHSDNGDRYPVLDCVEVAFEPKTASGAGAELVSVERIRSQGAHNLFIDLIQSQERWHCTFCEGEGHVGWNYHSLVFFGAICRSGC